MTRLIGTVTESGACCISVTVVMPVAMEVTKESSTASNISCDLFKSWMSIAQLYHFFNLIKICDKALTVKSISALVVSRPKENRRDPSVSFAFGLIASITCEAWMSPDLQALLDEAMIPLAESSMTKRSLGIFGIVIFILFGKRFFKSPFIINSAKLSFLLRSLSIK